MLVIITDLLILLHVLHWLLNTWPVRNNQLSEFLNTICNPMDQFLSQFVQLKIKGNAVLPPALTILCLAFLRLVLSVLY